MVMQIKDKLGRPIRDLRISVTDRCNFRCDYCMPKEIFGDDFVFLPKDELLTFEEIERIAEIYAELGVKNYVLPEENLYCVEIYINSLQGLIKLKVLKI